MVQISKTLSPSKYNAVYHGLAVILKGLFGNLTIMKKLTVLLFIILAFTACSKKDDPTLTGTWDMTNTFETSTPETFHGTLSVTQTGESISGSYTFSDNSGVSTFLPTSKITGSSVNIDFNLGAYTLSFQGTTNSNHDSMQGFFYYGALRLGSWSALKK